MNDEVDAAFQAIVTSIIARPPAAAAGSSDPYDAMLAEFLRRANKLKYGQKLQWKLMHAGMRAVVAQIRSDDRAYLKRTALESQKEETHTARLARKRAKAKEYAAIGKQRREADAKYAKEHGISIDQVYEHRQQSDAAAFRANLNAVIEAAQEEANKRALDIMGRWLCGGKPLGECTNADLIQHAQKEEALAAGHKKNVAFYLHLRERLSDGQTVREGIKYSDLVEIFDNVFGRNAQVPGALTRTSP